MSIPCSVLRCRTTCDNVNAYGTSPVEYITACGGSGSYEGTWRWTEEGDEIQMELEENGQVLYYEVHSGMLHTGVWTETEDGIDVSIDDGVTDLNFYTTDRKDALQPWWTPTLFVKTNGLEVPRASIAYLECYDFCSVEHSR